MSIVSVQPTYSGLSGSATLGGVREYTKVFTVRTDSYTDGVMAIGNASAIPNRGDVYTWHGETDAGALCYDWAPVQDPDNQLVWEVTCLYSSDLGGGVLKKNDPRYDVDNPLNAPPEVSWGSWSEEVVVTHDVNGQQIYNAAFLPFYPPLTRRRKQRMVTIVRNEAVYPVAIDQQYQGAINSDVFYSWSPLTAMMEDLTAQALFSQGMLYWRVRYEIRFRKPNWKQEVADAGAQYFKLDAGGAITKNDDGTKKLFNTEDDDVISTHPVYLNSDGTRMSQDDVALGLVNFLYIQVDPALPFSALNL